LEADKLFDNLKGGAGADEENDEEGKNVDEGWDEYVMSNSE
jgi:hypothetical protein